MPSFFLIALACLLVAASPAQTVKLSIDPNKKGAPIQPFIYGQFIEHLGRCIYGGIWAEMLEDRKFYYPITTTYHPYRAQTETPYPILGASPWELGQGSVEMRTDHVFVGQHSPLLEAGTIIRHHDLGVIAGKKVVGSIWARSDGALAKVRVRMGTETHEFGLTKEYGKHRFEFSPTQSTDKATFEIEAVGGDVQVGCASLMPADHVRGMRADTLAKLKELGGTIYRWPGGNFVSGYNWRDGIGDRDRRPPRTNPAWTGLEHNDFGTDEFIDFCHEIGAEPLITVNTGFGDAYSAAQWVEYCNGSADTVGGGWRVKNGHSKPFGVEHWCVGNEMWGPWQLGFMALNHYVIKHNQVVDAMRHVDPKLVLVGSGDIHTINKEHDPEQAKRNISWSQGMLEGCSDHMDALSEHFYVGRLPWQKNGPNPLNEHIKEVRDAIRDRTRLHRELQPKLPALKGRIVPIAMDEWNYWHRETYYGELGCPYDLADGLGIAAGLHEFYRQSDIVSMATYAQTVNVIGAIKTSRTAAELESTGLVLALYRKQYGTIPVTVSGEFGDMDVAAALTADGKALTIGIVNPADHAVTLFVDGVKGDPTSWFVTGPSAGAKNTPGQARQVDIVPGKGWVVPPLSCGVIRVAVNP